MHTYIKKFNPGYLQEAEGRRTIRAAPHGQVKTMEDEEIKVSENRYTKEQNSDRHAIAKPAKLYIFRLMDY